MYTVSLLPLLVATRKMVLPLAFTTEPILMVELPFVVSVTPVSVSGAFSRTFRSYLPLLVMV